MGPASPKGVPFFMSAGPGNLVASVFFVAILFRGKSFSLPFSGVKSSSGVREIFFLLNLGGKNMGKKDKKHEEKEVMVPEKAELVSPFEEMERWFGDFFNRPFFSPMWMPRFNLPRMQQVTPSLDIYEEEDAVVVKAELPGIGKEDVEVDISDDLLTISGEKKAEEKLERKDYHRIERSYGSFSRSVRLPGEVLSDQAKASFKDGVLEVRIPKTEAAKQKRRKIEIE
jgi:HSP20 family protein